MQRSSFLAATAAALAVPAAARATEPVARPRVLSEKSTVALGDDVFVRDAWRDLRGRAVGIVTNPSGVLSTGEPLVDAVHRNGQIAVKALFGPEHGIRGTVLAGETVGSSTDEKTGLPVHSLYG
ncbi:MAG TPA: exo-beta-N-acetylmuramidase NamZ domain-containing protein, partial [Candidatus Elarobacter sp.]